ncbi:nickel/cobalt transporter [Halomonas sp. MCCC 1A17488]|uniref:Nickel/cobalt efflux system n=2 Tax=Oceanospirillales TaxID=135619 RepID=A0ABX7WA16_9GAMM|nr:nickel/cobalt transporter [Halomonas sp. MCCC 1A17488]MCG3241691.1 nickel/cobalt transporter [Halomonas sp. MCCC 1A17488]QPP51717.1 nickel/cobalt transporter [Halomonas sp. SS10-MC5]QTP57204.1 nickel/cobalt transporter [Halomonas sulfidoxydans]
MARAIARAPARTWWIGLVLLAIAGLLLFLGQGGLQSLSLQLVAWQRDFHRALTLAISEFSGAPSTGAWGALLGVSFGYGVFHAAGPGHGKAVLTTYLLSQGGAVRRALALSFAASLLQGLVAIGLVVVLVHGLGWVTRQAMGSVAWVEQASFLMVALLGGWLCLRAIRQLRRPAGSHASLAHDHAHDHDHDHTCCGGQHHVDPRRAADWRTALATVVAIGIRPCSGGVLLLGAATLLGQFAVGVAAVMVMALGTALTVSGLALASVVARGWAERQLLKQNGMPRVGRLLSWAALGGGLVIMALGISLSVTGVTQPASAPLLGEPPARSNPPEGSSPPGGHPLGG